MTTDTAPKDPVPTILEMENTPIIPILRDLPSHRALVGRSKITEVLPSSTSATDGDAVSGADVTRVVHEALQEFLESDAFKAHIAATIPDPGDITVSTAMKWGDWLWKGVVLAGFLVFGGWQAYEAINGYVTDDDLAHYDEHNVDPLEVRVGVVEEAVTAVKSDVSSIGDLQAADAEYQQIKRKLDRYQRDYDEAMAEYTADRAAGKPAERPRKDSAHRDLEDELRAAEAKLLTTERTIIKKRRANR